MRTESHQHALVSPPGHPKSSPRRAAGGQEHGRPHERSAPHKPHSPRRGPQPHRSSRAPHAEHGELTGARTNPCVPWAWSSAPKTPQRALAEQGSIPQLPPPARGWGGWEDVFSFLASGPQQTCLMSRAACEVAGWSERYSRWEEPFPLTRFFPVRGKQNALQ